ncbi:MAG: heavy metal translocating P-type ATPase [Caldilineaceae bacterium]
MISLGALAVAGGALYVSVNALRFGQHSKRPLWLSKMPLAGAIAAAKSNEGNGVFLASGDVVVEAVDGGAVSAVQHAMSNKVQQWLTRVHVIHVETEERYHLWMERRFNNLFSNTRHQYLHSLAIDPNALAAGPEDRALNRNIARLAGIVTLAVIGQFIYPPVMVLTVLLALYAVSALGYRAIQTTLQQKHLTIDALQFVFIIGTFANGYFITGGLFAILMRLVRKFVKQTRDQSRKNLINVFGQQPRTVWVLVDGAEVELPFEQLQAGDTVVIQAGQMIPADGVIIKGMASVDQQRLTGEARAIEKTVGDAVLAATVVLSGRIFVQVEKTGAATLAAQIGEMLKQTTEQHLLIEARGMQMADRWVTPTFLLSAFALPFLGLDRAVAILGCSPGLGMYLMSPHTLLNFLNLTARYHILVKDGRSLELLHKVDTVIFDKTGTLTLDQFELHQIYPCATYSTDQILCYAAAAEQRQTHPLAKAILAAAQAQHLTLPAIENSHYELGYGLKVRTTSAAAPDDLSVETELLIRVGSERFMNVEGIAIPDAMQTIHAAGHTQGYSCVYVAVGDQLAGLLELQPTVRPEAKAVVAALHQRGLKLFIISGDQTEPTRKLAQELGIDHYFANVLPTQKAELVAQLHQEGRMVCFVGDGINDAIALKKAQVSISLRGATSVATDTAQIVLMDQTLGRLPLLFELAEELHRNLNRSMLLATIPDMALIAGVFLAHVTIPTIWATNFVCLTIGLTNVMWPVFKPRLLSDEVPPEA